MTITKASLLANAHDANGDTLTVTGLTADHGTFADNGNGTVTFTPAASDNLAFAAVAAHT